MAVTPSTATTYSGLTASTVIASADLLAADVSGNTRKITAGNFRASLFAFAAQDPLNCGILTAVGNSTITGTLSGVTTFSATTVNATTVTGTGAVSGATLAASGAITGGALSTITVSRASGANSVALTLSDNVTGAQSEGFGTELRFSSNGGGAISGILGAAGGTGGNNESELRFRTQASAGTLTDRWLMTYQGHLITIADNSYDIGQSTSVGRPRDLYLGRTLYMSAAVAKIVPGATSLSFRNNADSIDNLLIPDNGTAAFRNGISTGGSITAAIGPINVASGTGFQFAGTTIAGARKTGWTAQTTALLRGDMGATPTLATTYSTLAALITDLFSHGLIGT